MILFTGFWYFIRRYRSTYVYILFSKHFEKICITVGFEPVISRILSAVITITLQAVLHMSVIRVIFNRSCSPSSRHLAGLVSDIRRGTSSAARAGHDIAGPGLHLEVRVLACQ